MALPVIDFNTGRVVETDPFLTTEAADFSTPQSGFERITGGLGDIFGGLMGAGQSFLSSPDALMGLAGGLLTREAYDRLSNIGEQAKREAMGLAERGQRESEFRPFTVTTPTGAMFTARMGGQPMATPMPRETFGYGTGPDLQPLGQPSMMLPPSDQLLKPGDPGYQVSGLPRIDPKADALLQQFQQQLIDSGYQPPSPLSGQLLTEIQAPQTTPFPMQQPTADGLQIGMTLSPEEQALQQQLLGGAGGFFGQAMTPTQAREQAVFDRIRATQLPEEERQRLALEERLLSQGRLGTSSATYGGATPEQLALATAQEEARNRAMLTAMQQAQAEQAQQAALGGQLLGASFLPQQQLIEATRPGLIQQELAQQAQQFGTGLFGETALSGIEAQLLQEQARANLLGGIGSNVISGLINQQRAAASQGGSGGSSGLGGLFGDIADDLGTVGSGIRRLFNL